MSPQKGVEYARWLPLGFEASHSGPTPVWLFGCTPVWASVLSSNSARMPAGVSVGVRWRSSAAAPATCGVAAEVPWNPEPREHDDDVPSVTVETLSGASRSGLTRPSIVGPCEL